MMLFLSTFTNKIDKKGRVSVPANFRNVIRKQDFQGVIIYASFVNDCIEACGMERISELSANIDNLDPYSEERDAFATAILGGSYQLSFDSDGRVLLPENLISKARLDNKAVFIGKGKTFEIWNPEIFSTYMQKAQDTAFANRKLLKFNKNDK
ncbi:MAG: cell division/cell wall cluster transcriptional repressor MraZ [Alphaproteobacteria bacterium]|nr:cell division/cell wall cluster transcriptional repressor MraZ [Alphaproteobacteria bacterium]